MHFWLRSPPKSSLILTCYLLLYIYNYLSSLILVCVAKACVENNLLCDMLLLPSPWLRVSFRCNHYVIYHNLCHNCGWYAPCFGCNSSHRHLLQLHHVYGGLLSCDNHHDPQLSPQIGRHAWNATMGEMHFSAMDPMGATHGSAWWENN